MMTKDALLECLPIVREALARCTGGEIAGGADKLILTIHVDVDLLFEEIIASHVPRRRPRK